MLSVVDKIYARILVDRIREVTGCLIDDDQGVFRARKGCIDHIFTLKQISEKAREKMGNWTWRRHMRGLIGKHYGKY